MHVEPVSPRAPSLTGRVIMSQQWLDLSYLHWAVPPSAVAHLMPPGVEPDTIDGSTYVGLIPFRMVGAGVGRGPALPWLGTFLETNVRLYSVDATGRRGVVFLSLDADRLAVVVGARASFGVPYRWAHMSHRRREEPAGVVHEYNARLRGRRRSTTSRIVVRVGAPRTPTDLDHFLSARWGLHTRWAGRTLYVPNEHEQWPMLDAELLELDDGLVRAAGLGDLTLRPPDHLGFSPGVRTTFGMPTDAATPRAVTLVTG